MAKAAQLHDLKIDELSLVFAKKDGSDWAPRNQEARVLAVKGGAKKLGEKIAEVVKSYFISDYATEQPGPYPVSEAVDNIDNDGDGPSDYNEIAFAIAQVYYDIQQAFSISDDKGRSAAIVSCIDSFISGLDAMRSGSDEEKAGARHSEADRQHLDAILAAQTGIGEHIAAIQGALRHLGITSEEGQRTEDEGPEEDGGGPNNSQVDDDADKAKKKEDGKYGDVAYADEKNKKYPIDTEEHARAAWSYINQEKNAAEYSSDELAEIKSRIRAACKKFGIEISDEKASEKSGEIEMTAEEIAALVAAEVAKATAANDEKTAAAVSAAKAESDAALAQAKAEAEAAKAEAAKSAEKAAEDRELLKAIAGKPSTTSSLSASVAAQKSRLQTRMVEEMRNNPESPVI